tara:strand:+ start:6568 stop:7023 length:456 start_codon:yes stop_codon:yes gene_type:complete
MVFGLSAKANILTIDKDNLRDFGPKLEQIEDRDRDFYSKYHAACALEQNTYLHTYKVKVNFFTYTMQVRCSETQEEPASNARLDRVFYAILESPHKKNCYLKDENCERWACPPVRGEYDRTYVMNLRYERRRMVTSYSVDNLDTACQAVAN